MEELICKLSPKAWFDLSTNPYNNVENQITPSTTISAGDRFVESELAKFNLH